MATANSPLYNQIHATCLAYISSFATARTEGAAALNSSLAPHCKRFYSPISLQSLLPPSFAAGESNESYATRMQIELDTMSHSREPLIRYIVIDENARKASVNAILYGKVPKSGIEYPFEFVWFLEVNGEGTLIERIQVVADTGMATKFFEENQEVFEQTKGSSG